jgi:hypothetical protein
MIEIPCTIDTNLARSPLLLEYVDRLLRMRPRSIIYRCQIETWSLGLLRVPYDYFVGNEDFRLVYAPTQNA